MSLMQITEVKNTFALEWEKRNRISLEQEASQTRIRTQSKFIDQHILTLDIEPTNICNLHCFMCARTVLHYNHSSKIKLGFMDFGLYKHIIDQAVKLKLMSLRLALYGEPLLHPQIIDMISYAKDSGITDVGFNTNGTLLDEPTSVSLLKSGLDRLIFSIDSPYPHQFERIRKGAKLESVLRNIKRFYQLRYKMGITNLITRSNLVLMEENANAIQDYLNLMKNFVDVVSTGYFHDFTSQASNSLIQDKSFACNFLWTGMVVGWDGRVYICSIDAARELCVGNANHQSLKEIWIGKTYRHLRHLHKTGHWKDIALCRKCNLVDALIKSNEI